jgi:hypothetical protein
VRWKQIEDRPKVFALIFETGDEIAGELQRFSKSQELAGSSFKTIGALSYAKLGWFNWETRKYDLKPAFSTSNWSCSRSLATSLSGMESHRRTRMRSWDAPTGPPTVATCLRLACVRPAN